MNVGVVLLPPLLKRAEDGAHQDTLLLSWGGLVPHSASCMTPSCARPRGSSAQGCRGGPSEHRVSLHSHRLQHEHCARVHPTLHHLGCFGIRTAHSHRAPEQHPKPLSLLTTVSSMTIPDDLFSALFKDAVFWRVLQGGSCTLRCPCEPFRPQMWLPVARHMW